VLAILLGLLAALLFAVGTVFMQKGTLEMPEGEAEKPGFLLKLARRPVWLLGIGADLVGYVAQAGALAVGRLVVVQPLLIATVVFALPLGVKFTGQRVGRREIVGAVLVTGGIALFVILNNPDEGKSDAPWGDWLIACAVFLGIAAVLFVGARRFGPGVKAAMLGTAAGGLLGLASALTKATVTRFDEGFGAVFGDWHVYALVAVSVVGFSLLQSALATGSLAPAIATNMSVETIASIVLGIVLFDENLRGSPALLAVSIVALLVAFVGLVMLARSEGGAHARPAPEPSKEPVPA
jgi:drug/metabolite transporter (DMT)-like permease